MTTYNIQAPDGKTYQIDGPGGASDEQVRAAVLSQHPDAGKPAQFSQAKPAPGFVGKIAGAVGDAVSAYGDAGATLASGAVAPIAGGLAGAGQAIGNTIQRAAGGTPTVSAADATQSVEGALTYQPRTRGGAEYVDAISTPLRMIARAGDKAGSKVAEVTHSPAAGAAVNTAIQMAPALIDPALRAGRAAGVIKPAVGATAATSPATSAAAAATRAETYARTRLGVDWDSLSKSFKDTLTSIATDAKKLDALPVEAVKRQAQLQSLRVPVTTTAAKLTRDSTALRNEANVAATDTGKPIRDVDIQTNRDLRANVEGLRNEIGEEEGVRATANQAEDVGRAVHEPLRAKESLSKANYNQLYKTARETEPLARVSADPMYDFVKGNPEVLNPQLQHLAWLQTWLKKAGIERDVEKEVQAPTDRRGSLGEPIEGGESTTKTISERRPIKLTELDDLRQKAGEIARGGGTDGYYAGQVMKAIDKSFEEVPEAAKAWKEARKAFREHKNEFEETAAVERIVADKSKNDPKTALEDTWKKSIQTAKLEEIRQLKRSLLNGGSEETRTSGKKALAELKQETVNQYLQYITRKTATNEAGDTQITAVQMVEGLKHVGGEARLREILGERAVKELKNIIEAAKITKTEPSIRNAGSSTLQNVLAFAEKWIDKVPAVGGPIVGGIKLAGKVRELGESARTVREAVQQPTDRASSSVSRSKARSESRYTRAQKLRRAAPAVAAHRMTLRDDTQ